MKGCGFMNEYEALKDILADDQYMKEPLAAAILAVLSKEDPIFARKVLDSFNKIMHNRFDSQVKEHLYEQNGGEGTVIFPPE